MTKITLAWPQEGIGGSDETVDVDDATARRLIGDGLARYPDNVNALPDAEVVAVAHAEGVDLSDAHTARERKAAVKDARAEKES
jgi:hypothetical protein